MQNNRGYLFFIKKKYEVFKILILTRTKHQGSLFFTFQICDNNQILQTFIKFDNSKTNSRA